MNIDSMFIKILEKESALFDSEYHGIQHWRTVERNGLYLAAHTGADPMVVSYFSYLHDCMRENEYEDPEHGPRAARFAKSIRREINLSDKQFEKLAFACSGHTFGRNSKCPTIKTCWDSDRLDIGRVGIIPDARYLFSDEAKRITDEGDFSILELR